MEEALKHCRKHLGDNATILYNNHATVQNAVLYEGYSKSIVKIVKKQGKEAGGPWDCYNAGNFYGWEADRVVAVTSGGNLMEMITRAKTLLAVIIVGPVDDGPLYDDTKEYFQKATEQGLIEEVQLKENQQLLPSKNY